MTNTHPQNTQSVLDMWQEQLRSLTDPQQATEAINTIYERLMKLHTAFEKNGMEKQAGQVSEAYELALSIYQDLQQRQQLIEAGAGAIEETERRRQEAMTELKQLLRAVETGDESHPLLEKYAQEMREDHHEQTLSDPYVMESVYENAVEQADEALYEMISERWDVSWEVADGVVGLLGGNVEATQDQQDLIVALLKTLEKPRSHDPLSKTLQTLGGVASSEESDDADE